MRIKEGWMRHRHQFWFLIVFMAVLGGCSAKDDRGLTLRTVSVTDFSNQQSSAAGAPAASQREAPSSAPATAAASASSTSKPSTLPAGERNAPVASGRPLKTGEPIIVEAVIGQVSGRPIFADALLAPRADQLVQEAQKARPGEFPNIAARIVSGRLNELVLEELFLAEAEASLTTQQQQGLLAFLRQFREKTVAESLGIVSERQRELQQERGMTVDQYVDLRRNEVLIQKLLYEKVEPRVIVSWKDVEREYERRKSEFNPPANVTLMILRLSNASQKEQIDQLKTCLEAGQSFDATMTAMKLEPRTFGPVPMNSDDVSDIDINEAYKAPLKGLREGQTTAGFEIKEASRDETVWIHVQKIDQPPGRSLYDVQRQLIAELYKKRRDEQRERYIKSLFDRGIYSQLDEMNRRALMVALMRYGR